MYNEGYKNAKQQKMSENSTFTIPENILHMLEKYILFLLIFLPWERRPRCRAGSITKKPRASFISIEEKKRAQKET